MLHNSTMRKLLLAKPNSTFTKAIEFVALKEQLCSDIVTSQEFNLGIVMYIKFPIENIIILLRQRVINKTNITQHVLVVDLLTTKANV